MESLNFLFSELSSTKLQAQILAASHINIVATSIGEERTKIELLPRLFDLLFKFSDNLTLLLLCAKAFTEEDCLLMKYGPEESLKIIWELLINNEESELRDVGNKALEIVISKNANEEILTRFYNENIKSVFILKKWKFMRGAILYCSLLKLHLNISILSFELIQDLIQDSSSSFMIREVIAKNINLLLSTENVTLAKTLLFDSNDSVVIAALPHCLLMCISSETLDIGEKDKVLRKVGSHENWNIRKEILKSFSTFLLRNVKNKEKDILEVICLFLERRLKEEEEEILVNIEALELISRSPLILEHISIDLLHRRMNEFILVSQRNNNEKEVKLALARSHVQLFTNLYHQQCIKNNGTVELEHLLLLFVGEKDQRVNSFLIDALMNEKFITNLNSSAERCLVMKRIHSSLKFIKNDENKSVDVTNWRIFNTVLKRTGNLIKLSLKYECDWSGDCMGLDFLENCIISPCVAIGNELVRVLPEIIDQLGWEWFKRDFVNMILKVITKHQSSIIKTCILGIIENILIVYKKEDAVDDLIVNVFRTIAIQAINDRSIVVKIKGIEICILIAKKMNDNDLIKTIKSTLECDSVLFIEFTKEIQI